MLVLFYTVLFLMLWSFLGIVSFIYWWTKSHDLTSKEIPLIGAYAMFGPITWLIGWLIHYEDTNKCFIKKRK